MVDTDRMHLSEPIERTTPSMNPKGNHGLWAMMRYQRNLIDCNKHTTLVRDVDYGGVSACGGPGGICEISTLASQFCYEPNTALNY